MLTYCPSLSHCSFIPLLSLHPLSPPSFTYGGKFCSTLHFNNSEKRGLVYSFTSSALPSCDHPPLLLAAFFPSFSFCLFLSFAAGSLFTGSSWREGCFWMATKGARDRRGSLCDWLSWPPTCSGNRVSCPKALWLFRSLCNSLLVIYSYACSFLSGESLRNVRPQLSALLYIGCLGVVEMITLTLRTALQENEGQQLKWCDHKSGWQL